MSNLNISAIALDLGTTSIKAALMDADGMLHHITRQDAPAIDTDNGHYESNALSYLKIAEQVVRQCLAHADTDQKPPLGLCSQRSSFVIWDKTTGDPITPLISWQDDRGSQCCTRLQSSTPVIQQLTGLRLTPYYLAPKLNVLLQENLTWRDQLIQNEWLVGTLDTFLIWHWTEGQHFMVDASMAARTLLMDIQRQRWSKTLCELFEIPIDILPSIQPSTQLNIPLKTVGLRLTTSVADQSAAFLASIGANIAHTHDRALVNLGTGGFVIRNTPEESPVLHGYLQTLIYQPVDKPAQLAIEGTLNSIAAALAPFPVKECAIEDMASTDIFCIAEPSGLGAPYFRQDYGLFFSHAIAALTRQQTATLLLEAITFRITRIVEDFHRQSPVREIYLSGGLSALPCLQQSIRQCVGVPVYYLQQKEASLQGTALLTCETHHAFDVERIEITDQTKNDKLQNKFLAWKKWLDDLLLTNI